MYGKWLGHTKILFHETLVMNLAFAETVSKILIF